MSWFDIDIVDADGSHPFEDVAKLSVLLLVILLLPSCCCGGDGIIPDSSWAGSNKLAKSSISISSIFMPPISIKFQLMLSNSVTFVVVGLAAS